jgi:hypothetical protein
VRSCVIRCALAERRWQSLNTHDRGYCGAHELFALPQLVFVRGCGACARMQRARAAILFSGAYDLCAAASSDARWLNGAGNR